MVRTAAQWKKYREIDKRNFMDDIIADLAACEHERNEALRDVDQLHDAAMETEDKLDALKAQVNEYARTIEDLEQEKFEREKALTARAQKAEAEFAEYRYACDATHLDDITEIRRLKTDLAACEKERDAFKHLLDTCQYGRDTNFVRAEKAEADAAVMAATQCLYDMRGDDYGHAVCPKQAEVADLSLRLEQLRGVLEYCIEMDRHVTTGQMLEVNLLDSIHAICNKARSALSAPPGELAREVRGYMKHKDGCRLIFSVEPEDHCTCGLDDLLAKMGG